MDERPSNHASSGSASQPKGRGPSRRLLIAIGGGVVALGLGAAVATSIFQADPQDEAPPPAAEGGLKIELGNTQGGDRIDPARPLRCFVEGRMVGELTVAACAQRNGVAAQNLDVGLDDAGELAAVVAVPGLSTEPLGAEPEALPEPVVEQEYAPPPLPTPTSGPVGECLRHAGGDWRLLGEALQLDTCVQLLFAGRCEPAGSAAYGRWSGQTVRLVTGRVEIAPDGANFRTLVEQDASCMLP